MREVTQRDVAKRLRGWMKAKAVDWSWLAKQFGFSEDHIRRWGRPGALKKPPSYDERRKLERLTGMPAGYLDGADQGVSLPHAGPADRAGENGSTPDGDIGPEEEQFRIMLRNLRRTIRGHRSDPELFDAQEGWKLELAFVHGFMLSRQLSGDPMPDWLTRTYNDLLTNEPQ